MIVIKASNIKISVCPQECKIRMAVEAQQSETLEISADKVFLNFTLSLLSSLRLPLTVGLVEVLGKLGTGPNCPLLGDKQLSPLFSLLCCLFYDLYFLMSVLLCRFFSLLIISHFF